MVDISIGAEETFRRAVAAHQAGRLDDAALAYRAVLGNRPNHFDALNLLAVIEAQRGAFAEADRLWALALAVNPQAAPIYLNRGNVLQKLLRLDEALACYDRALALMPEFAEALSNRGVVLKKLDRLEEALSSYDKALALRPDYAEALSNRGVALKELMRFDEALASYDKALAAAPGDAEVLNNRGVLLREMKRFDEAVANYDTALARRPRYAEAWNNRGNALVELNRADEAIACYERALAINPNYTSAATNRFKILQRELKDPEATVNAGLASVRCLLQEKYSAGFEDRTQAIPLFRLEHDLEQSTYLLAHGLDFDGLRQAHEAMSRLYAARSTRLNSAGMIAVSREEVAGLAIYDKALFVREPPRLSHYLHPDTDWAKIEATYFGKRPEIVYFDNLLSPSALAALRTFCLESTVWKTDYANQYIGAFSMDGFISQLHLKIALELQEKMPRIFGGLGLEDLWAFKYSARLQTGIGVHADHAKVNLNFWITPDEAVLDPTSGGLKVYDVPSPPDWPFSKYNHNEEGPAIYKFLKENGANCVTVPYRCNRAVLFNSALFHETDEIHFKEGYENRRINMTYLFGRGLAG